MKEIPCLCCGEPLEVAKSAKGKPCLHCPECAVQVFVRGSRGVRLFAKKYGGEWTATRGETPAEPTTTTPAGGAPRAEERKPSKGSKSAAKVGAKTGTDAGSKPGAEAGAATGKSGGSFFLD